MVCPAAPCWGTRQQPAFLGRQQQRHLSLATPRGPSLLRTPLLAVKDVQVLLLPPPPNLALLSPGLFSLLKEMLDGADLQGCHTGSCPTKA